MREASIYPASIGIPTAVGGQYLTRLTYVSESTQTIDSAGLEKILNHARRQNLLRGITGMLCFNNELFLQTLEGSRPVLNALYGRLVADRRHTNVQLIELVEIPRRDWSRWSMGYAVAAAQNREVFLRHSPAEVFDPYSMTAEAIQAMMKELVTTKMQRANPLGEDDLPGV